MTKFLFLTMSLLISGCAPSLSEGVLGKSAYQRILYLGESVAKAEAIKYGKQYNAVVIYSPSSGAIADATTKALNSAIGPDSFMKWTMLEFRSMSNTSKDWEVIIPRRTERYFLVTLRNMENNDIVNAHGLIILPESSVSEGIKNEVSRVFGNGFRVVFKEN